MAVTGLGKAQPSTQVLRSIAAASEQTGVSFDYLLNQASRESSFNPTAKAPTSSAAGLYQFTKGTWLATVQAHGKDHGLGWAADAIQRTASGTYSVPDKDVRDSILELRNDPAVASQMAAELAADNSAYVSQHLGRDPSPGDLALSHFLGAEGAVRFLTALDDNPEASAAPLFPEAAAANHAVFYDASGAPRSLADIKGQFEARAGTAPGVQVQTATVTTQQQYQARSDTPTWSEQLPAFEPMPQHLSLQFAQSAYQRLAAMDGKQ